MSHWSTQWSRSRYDGSNSPFQAQPGQARCQALPARFSFRGREFARSVILRPLHAPLEVRCHQRARLVEEAPDERL
eukprot:15247525-Alexandrium_andersonii.AAC.1